MAPFILIPLALTVALAWGVNAAWQRAGEPGAAARRAALLMWIAALAWMTITWIAAGSGRLGDWQTVPPPFTLLMAATILLAVVLAFSPVGTRLATLPLWALVGVQGFRFPLELAMHRMFEQGIMPIQMSYSGLNLDIVSGITALAVAAAVWWGRGGMRLVARWNVVGFILLANIVTVAILSTPPIAFFGPDRLNVWITLPPFVWLPSVMVLAALAGHLLIFRALARHVAA